VNRGFRIGTAVVVVVVGGAFFAGARVMKPTRYAPVAAPSSLPPGAAPDFAPFEAALARFRREDGGADYAAWRADAAAAAVVDRLLADAGAYAPHNAADRFPDGPARVRYWLHVAQAMQVRVVLDTAVADVLELPAPLSVVPGDGLLRRRSFLVGGKPQTLFGLVRTWLAADASDPRVVFALGGVCRALGPLAVRIPEGAEFDAFLAARTEAFFSDPRECELVDGGRAVRVASRLLLWRDLFLGGRRGVGSGDPDDALRAALAERAPPALAAALRAAPPPRVVAAEPDWRVR
jgi:hypothetical protein